MSEIREKVTKKLTERAMRKWNVGPTAVNGTPQPSCLEEVLGKEWETKAWTVYLASMIMNSSLIFIGLCTIVFVTVWVAVGRTYLEMLYYWIVPSLVACLTALPFALKYGDDEMELRLVSQEKRRLEKNWINSELEKISRGKN